MRDDVLKTISSAKDITNAIVLTHNIDFVFIQTVVLAAFRRCGNPTLTIFADAACAAESFSYQQPVVTGLGERYRVVPVAMDPGFRFHPKAVLLSGEESATLLVGSGNLTFGGWRENAEVWVRFDSEQDGVKPFHAFKDYLTEILSRVPLPDAVSAEIDESFDPKSKSWVSTESEGEARLVGRVGSRTSLLDRMLEAVGNEPVDELVVCAPYFDDDGVGLQNLINRTGAGRTRVFCQPERTTLTARSWEPSAGYATLQRADFTRVSDSGEERSAFMHAKLYAFRRGDEVITLVGSANCSRAALTIMGSAGNAELQAVRIVTSSEFQEEFLGELKITSEQVALRDEPTTDSEEEPPAGAVLRILAARFEVQTLLVAYAPADAQIIECLVERATTRFKVAEKGVLRITCNTKPDVVLIRARVDGEVVEAAPAWVDHEHSLRTTARGRSLIDSIRTRLQPGEWSASAWTEVMDAFCKYLRYMPQHRAGRAASRRTFNDNASGEVEFTAEDVFSPAYRASNLEAIRLPGALDSGRHSQSLHHLLLRWFGIPIEEPEDEGETSGVTDEEGDDEIVDRPESLHVPPPSDPTPTAETSKRDKRRIEALLSQIEVAMTSTEFLEERDPEYLAADLKVAPVLLRLGLRQGWVERERFFDLTQKIWSAQFFSFDRQSAVGWLERRAHLADDRGGFVGEMQSAELSAALIGWKLAAPTDEATPEAARLELAAVLSVARLPWLWQCGERERIAEELKVLLSHTANRGTNRDALLRQAWAERDQLLRRGQALRLLEAAVCGMTPVELSDRIKADNLDPGDLLWQGKAGFCVVRKTASRVADNLVTVLKLQGTGGEVDFQARSTIPMLALLDEGIVPPSDAFGDAPRQVLREFIDQLSRGFRQ